MRLIGTVFVVGVLLAGSLGAQKPQEVALQAAMRTETVAGDLKAAIAQYQAIVEEYARTDRAVAATALVRMAECHHKLGEQQATRLFERVLREFGDQKAAATLARARLGSIAPPSESGVVNRQVWKDPADPYDQGAVSADGQLLCYVDWDTGDLALREISRGTNRRLTNKGSWTDSSDYAQDCAISPDNRHVAYSWFDAKAARYELRLVTDGRSAATPPRVLLTNPDIKWIAPYDWSSDGRSLAVQVRRVDQTAQIGLVRASDGSFTLLKSVEWRGTTRIFFSPDGSRIVFDLPQSEKDERRDVFIMHADGSREVPLIIHPANDTVAGWSPDGGTVLFASDRTGARALWGAPLAGGTPRTPFLIKAELGTHWWSMGVTQKGSFVYKLRTGARFVAVADVDLDTGRILSRPAHGFDVSLRRVREGIWSPDGRQLVAVGERSGALSTLLVRSLGSDTVKEVRTSMSFIALPRWAPDGSVAVRGIDGKGREGLHRVDLVSGDSTPLVLNDTESAVSQASWSPTGDFIVYRRARKGNVTIARRSMPSEEERPLQEGEDLFALSLSPDGRLIAYVASDTKRLGGALYVMPVDGGAPRELHRVAAPARLWDFSTWTPDGRQIIFGKTDGGSSRAWRISPAGGPPAEMDASFPATPLTLHSIRLHPLGRQIMYETGQDSAEIWSLEEFLPQRAVPAGR